MLTKLLCESVRSSTRLEREISLSHLRALEGINWQGLNTKTLFKYELQHMLFSSHQHTFIYVYLWCAFRTTFPMLLSNVAVRNTFICQTTDIFFNSASYGGFQVSVPTAAFGPLLCFFVSSSLSCVLCLYESRLSPLNWPIVYDKWQCFYCPISRAREFTAHTFEFAHRMKWEKITALAITGYRHTR